MIDTASLSAPEELVYAHVSKQLVIVVYQVRGCVVSGSIRSGSVPDVDGDDGGEQHGDG